MAKQDPFWATVTSDLRKLQADVEANRNYASWEDQDMATAAASGIEAAIRLSKRSDVDRGRIGEQLDRAIEALEDAARSTPDLGPLAERTRELVDRVRGSFWSEG